MHLVYIGLISKFRISAQIHIDFHYCISIVVNRKQQFIKPHERDLFQKEDSCAVKD